MHGGGAGAIGGAGSDGMTHLYLGVTSGGGKGATPTGAGVGGGMDDQSVYDQCTAAGGDGGQHQGGEGHKGLSCTGAANGGSWHLGSELTAPNGGGGGGGSGFYGGGGGASKATYSGGGGGGGISWAAALPSSSTSSQPASGASAGGSAEPDYNGAAGQGGPAGDKTQWPGGDWQPKNGGDGLVILEL